MSRWISKGLLTGIRTTQFPKAVSEGEEGAPARVSMRWQALTPALALSAARRCPTEAITASGTETAGEVRFDAGACIMCGRCVREFHTAFEPLNDPRVAVHRREHLRMTVRWAGDKRPQPVTLQQEAEQLQSAASRLFRHSLHIRHVDAGSCNGCESELQMLSAPYLDLHRLGLFFTPTPRHADVLLVTGVVTSNMEAALVEAYQAMPGPKLVVAAGACAISCGNFGGSPTVRGPLDRLLPVDAYIPGCPPTPQALLHGLLLVVGRAEERTRTMEAARDGT